MPPAMLRNGQSLSAISGMPPIDSPDHLNPTLPPLHYVQITHPLCYYYCTMSRSLQPSPQYRGGGRQLGTYGGSGSVAICDTIIRSVAPQDSGTTIKSYQRRIAASTNNLGK